MTDRYGNRIGLGASILLGTTLLTNAMPAGAQSAPIALPDIPSALDPSRIRENLERPETPTAPPRIRLPGPNEQLPPGEAENAKFVFRTFTIEGAHSISDQELRRAWPHQPGDTASAADVFRFAEAITNAYRRAGYALSFAMVPAQDIDSDGFTLRVVEGFVERVDVTGSAGESVRDRVAGIARRLSGTAPLRTLDLERALLLVNDLPGVTASAVLSPASSEGGAVLTITVAHDSMAASLSYNNLLPASLGDHLGGLSVELRGLATGSDLLRIDAQHALTGSTYRSVSGDYETGIGGNGLRVGLSGAYSQLEPDDPTLASVEYKGDTALARFHVDYPLIRSRDRTLRIGAAVAINNVGSDILGERLFDDRLRTVDLWGSYDLVDAGGGLSSITTTFSRGLSIMDARGNSRANGKTDFTTLSIDLRHNRPLAMAAGGKVSVGFDMHGQGALGSGGLLSPIECSYGGSRFGRAFDAGVFTGDQCLMGAATVHWVKPILPAVLDFYVFVDGGRARQKGVLEPGQVRSTSGASAGGGTAVQLGRIINGYVEFGRQVALSGGQNRNGMRVRGGVVIRF